MSLTNHSMLIREELSLDMHGTKAFIGSCQSLSYSGTVPLLQNPKVQYRVLKSATGSCVEPD